MPTLRDTWDGVEVPFLVMEYVEGTSLAQIIESERHLEHGEVMHVLLELLSVGRAGIPAHGARTLRIRSRWADSARLGCYVAGRSGSVEDRGHG